VIDFEKDSLLKRSIILEKNENFGVNQNIDMSILNMLKMEVIKKVREDFQLDRNHQVHENEAL
jgi:hypothetical protein